MTSGLVPQVLIYGVFWFWVLGLVPAAVVAALKERWLLFVAGWLTFGITWFAGAIPLADPGSHWARRFYGPERLARASDPIRNRRPWQLTTIWISGTLCLLLAVGLFAARPAPVLGVEGAALQHSVGGTNLSSSADPCQPLDSTAWTCQAYDTGFSSMVPYRVTVHRFGCWKAVRVGFSEEGSTKHLSGCITIWDEIRPLDGVL